MDAEFERRMQALEDRNANANSLEKAGGSGGGVHQRKAPKRSEQPDAQAGANQPADDQAGAPRRGSVEQPADVAGSGKPDAVAKGEKP
ncbi:MAG: hypothetical protein E5V78_24415 [Mesorhizobium sp.]|nr:MAG: hypothetical protein E5V78_24415 [Mesorhizobium sp.]